MGVVVLSSEVPITTLWDRRAEIPWRSTTFPTQMFRLLAAALSIAYANAMAVGVGDKFPASALSKFGVSGKNVSCISFAAFFPL